MATVIIITPMPCLAPCCASPLLSLAMSSVKLHGMCSHTVVFLADLAASLIIAHSYMVCVATHTTAETVYEMY